MNIYYAYPAKLDIIMNKVIVCMIARLREFILLNMHHLCRGGETFFGQGPNGYL